MIVGGYVLHLYCDTDDAHMLRRTGVASPGLDFGEFNGNNARDAKRSARLNGWTFRADKCFCPLCNKTEK